MRLRTSLFVLLALAACSDLPSVDDPRASSSYSEHGACDGVAVSCEHRTQAQCNAGCEPTTGCKSIALDQCAAIRDQRTCDGMSSCRWSVDECDVDVGITCDIQTTQVDCLADYSGACEWGPTCSGYADDCFEADTEAACTANAGCSWISGS